MGSTSCKTNCADIFGLWDFIILLKNQLVSSLLRHGSTYISFKSNADHDFPVTVNTPEPDHCHDAMSSISKQGSSHARDRERSANLLLQNFDKVSIASSAGTSTFGDLPPKRTRSSECTRVSSLSQFGEKNDSIHRQGTFREVFKPMQVVEEEFRQERVKRASRTKKEVTGNGALHGERTGVKGSTVTSAATVSEELLEGRTSITHQVTQV